MSDTILDSMATTSTLIPGRSGISERIDTPGDQDWWRISLTVGATYRFRQQAAPSSTVDPYLRLLNASGTLMASNDDGGGGWDAGITFTPAIGGIYYLSSQGVGSSIGAYQLNVSLIDTIPATTATEAQLSQDGATFAGNIDSAGDQDWWRISMYAGGNYTFLQNTIPDSELISRPKLFNDTGIAVAEAVNSNDHNHARITYTPTTSGTYYLSARGVDGSTGGYTLSASVNDTIPDNMTTTAVLSTSGAGSTVVGIIGSQTDQDWWRVSLTAGNLYSFSLAATSTSHLDCYLRLLDDTGTAILTDNDSGDGDNSLLSYTPTRSGIYYLSAEGDRESGTTGGYTLSATESVGSGNTNTSTEDSIVADTTTADSINPDGIAHNSFIDSSGDQDWWQISLTEGNRYSFRLLASTNSSLDCYLRLLDASGVEITKDDDSAGNRGSLINHTAIRSGTYYLSAQGYGSNTGEYLLSATLNILPSDPITDTTATDSSITINATAQASAINFSGDRDWWSLSLTAGNSYSFRLVAAPSSSLDCYLRLMDATGVEITKDDDSAGNRGSLITYTATRSGTYYLSAEGYGSSTGDYTLEATRSEEDPDTGGANTDTLESAISTTLPAGVANLLLTGNSEINGTGNDLDNIITGNSAINTLHGAEGADHLIGRGGNDTLNGGEGNDELDGGAGVDQMRGDAGDDIYIVDNLQDSITENPGSGNDWVRSSISWTLGRHLENLTLIGTRAIHGMGNAFNNVLTGNNQNNTLTGGEGNDILSGADGKDILWGGAGDDTLDGGMGTDRMYGESGDDIYIVDNSGDYISEGSATGTDLVRSSVTWTLMNNLENLTLTGTFPIDGRGNSRANTLRGNNSVNTLHGLAGADRLFGAAGEDTLFGGDGNDKLAGGSGQDMLSGGTGADQFSFTQPSDGGDIIQDFSSSQGDQLVFISDNFGNLRTGRLETSRFTVNNTGRASTSSQRFVFDTRTRALRYDPDGSGSAVGVTIATLNGISTLSVNEIQIVAS
ncbi:MAG: calcium-binding protein [Magnetococcales bacterium]|nr:calcium-binding protein [Magnetococcales bacterium]